MLSNGPTNSNNNSGAPTTRAYIQRDSAQQQQPLRTIPISHLGTTNPQSDNGEAAAEKNAINGLDTVGHNYNDDDAGVISGFDDNGGKNPSAMPCQSSKCQAIKSNFATIWADLDRGNEEIEKEENLDKVRGELSFFIRNV